MTTVNANVPNLDAMDRDELIAFAVKHSGGYQSRDLFPGGGRGTRVATRALVTYAWNAVAARDCRSRGEISIALNYERICQFIFNRLPQFARW